MIIPTGRFGGFSMDTRQMILETAFEGFMEKSFDSISLNELIKRTGLTKGAFYYHFKSKEELLDEVFDKYLHGYIVSNIDIIYSKDGSILERFEYAINKISKIQIHLQELSGKEIDTRSFMMLFQDGLRRSEKLREHNRQSQKRAMKLVADLLIEGQEKGVVREDLDPEEFSGLFSATIKGTIFDWTIDDSVPLEEVIQQNIHSLLKLVQK